MTVVAGGVSSEGRLCSVVSKNNGEDPIGSAAPFGRCLVVEVAPAWATDVTRSSGFPTGLLEALENAREHGLDKFLALHPEPGYSREGCVRVMHLSGGEEPFAAYEKEEFVVPAGELAGLVGALFGGEEDPSRFERYRQGTDPRVRDLLVCTHGRRDAACGKLGYGIYETLRRRYAGAAGGRLRIWRVSHLGGHRFAPTLLDLPEGRLWGHLEPWALENLVLRRGPVSELRRFCRGWAGMGFYEQIVEREIFVREGWAWTGYRKAGRTLELDEEDERAEVRIEYAAPDGGSSGVYEATVGRAGSVMTLSNSGTDPLTEAKQYRVTRLEKVSREERA